MLSVACARPTPVGGVPESERTITRSAAGPPPGTGSGPAASSRSRSAGRQKEGVSKGSAAQRQPGALGGWCLPRPRAPLSPRTLTGGGFGLEEALARSGQARRDRPHPPAPSPLARGEGETLIWGEPSSPQDPGLPLRGRFPIDTYPCQPAHGEGGLGGEGVAARPTAMSRYRLQPKSPLFQPPTGLTGGRYPLGSGRAAAIRGSGRGLGPAQINCSPSPIAI